MALTTGTINSATPATAFYNLMATAFTNAGWTNLSDITAATAGTTAANKVWVTADTSVASSVYTGCIVFIEVDDTNNRLRIRCAEKYDSSSAGSPATGTVKWAVPGCDASTNKTPTANYAFSDSFQTLFQAAAAGQIVGWIELTVLTSSGFNYWIGVNANRFVFFSNASGVVDLCYGGYAAYQGDVAASNKPVFLVASLQTSSSTTSGSWTISNASATPTANARVSRDIGAPATAGTAWFCFDVDAPSRSPNTTNQHFGGPGAGPLVYYTEPYMVFPAWLHGAIYPTLSATSILNGRACFATLPEAVVKPAPTAGAVTFDRTMGPFIGEQVTVGGTTYTAVGQIQTASTTTNNGESFSAPYLLIDGSQF